MLRQELEARLVVVSRKQFDVPAQEARRLVDNLVYWVLKKSILKRPRDRVLTQGDLYRAIDAATRISVPRYALEALAQLAPCLAGPLSGSGNAGTPFSTVETDWLIESATLPAPRGMVTRTTIESKVANVLENFGVGVLAGSSGLGKSILSRAVADGRASSFVIVDCRNINADETHRRLNMVLGRLGDLTSPVLILEDLNHFEDAHVALSLSRVIEASRRRYREVLITCYRIPFSKSLAEASLNQGCVVDCPYFSEEEVRTLVADNGGDPDKWWHLAHVAGANGHPQLTHAFITGMATREWPVAETKDIYNRGLLSGDIDAVRNAARRGLVSSLPEGPRNLLYRLSLIIGHFNRTLALTIGNILPAVSQSGESLDQLVGPWIERAGNDLFRVSPLAISFGQDMLSLDEQEHIHKIIADQKLKKGTVNVGDFDAIMMHAIAGKSPESLETLARSVVSFDTRTLEMITERLPLFRFLRTEVPIYPEDSSVSGLLRLAQFKLAAAGSETGEISDIATALFNEANEMPKSEFKRRFEQAAVSIVLSTLGVANYIDSWVNLLFRLKTMVEADDFLQGLITNVESSIDVAGSNFLSILFSIGSAGIASVDRLEHVINDLDEFDVNERILLLTPIHRNFSDYSLFINGPWATQRHCKDFDAADAAVRYRRMAKKTQNWGIRSLSLQCSVAEAVMLDEYQSNREGALAVLEAAATTQGDDLILSRAIAKIHWRHSDHRIALEIFRGIADQVGSDSPVERAFALREAAVSASKCNEWSLAENWFLEAQNVAELVQSDDMDAMAIGLGADSAVAALEVGGVDRALTRLGEAVEALVDVNPDATLCTAYCHRVIRHAVLWVQSRIERSNVKIGGYPIAMKAGTCSNPEPLPEIRKLPLAPIDYAWYMLAEAEITAGLNVGINAALYDRLPEGKIPAMELSLHMKTIQIDIDKLDAFGFAAHLTKYVEIAIYMRNNSKRLRATYDPLVPERGEVPMLDDNVPFDPEAEHIAKDAILAYGIRSVLASQPEAMTELEAVLSDQFTGPFPGNSVFNHWNEKSVLSTEIDQTVTTVIKTFLQNEHVKPNDFWLAGLCFFEWINQSNFKHLLEVRVAAWQRSRWKQILTVELFRLSRPRQTVPSIEKVLAMPTDDWSFVAKLLLATYEAVGIQLNPALRNTLMVAAEELDSPLNTT